jgi:hypothetical protein
LSLFISSIRLRVSAYAFFIQSDSFNNIPTGVVATKASQETFLFTSTLSEAHSFLLFTIIVVGFARSGLRFVFSFFCLTPESLQSVCKFIGISFFIESWTIE